MEKVLADMDNSDLDEQLKTVSKEKQIILEKIENLKQDDTRRAIRESRMVELREFLAQQPMKFMEYDDAVTRRLVERITVVDAETVRVKIKDAEVELEQRL